MGAKYRIELSVRLWKLAESVQVISAEVSAAMIADSATSRTLGNEGEYLECEAGDFAKKLRSVALRLNRCLAFCQES